VTPAAPFREFRGRDRLWIAALTLAWLAATAWARPLMLPDEGRYVGVAWEIYFAGGQFANLDMLVAGCITTTIVLLADAALCIGNTCFDLPLYAAIPFLGDARAVFSEHDVTLWRVDRALPAVAGALGCAGVSGDGPADK
jgi:hypothetical protein